MDELERIKNRDTEYWDKVLAEGTKKTLDYLESIKPKRRGKMRNIYLNLFINISSVR